MRIMESRIESKYPPDDEPDVDYDPPCDQDPQDDLENWS